MPDPQEAPLAFEAKLKAIEQCVEHMEHGQLPLDEALAAYQRGIELMQSCQKTLEAAQQRVKVLDAQAGLRDLEED